VIQLNINILPKITDINRSGNAVKLLPSLVVNARAPAPCGSGASGLLSRDGGAEELHRGPTEVKKRK